VQKVYWKADGTPDFGIPVADGVTPTRFSSYNFADRFVRRWEYRARIEANVSPLADSQFRVVTGLGGSDTVSLESANLPGSYLRHRNFEVWLEKNDGTTTFAADAAGVSYESYNYAGRYLRHYNYLLYVQTPATTTEQGDATFYTQ
jgi:hypothetical protein